MKITVLEEMHSFIEKTRLPWVQLFIIITGILPYANTLDVPFYLDDFNSISENQAIQIKKLTLGSITDAVVNSPHATRPVSYVSFALNYFLSK